MNWVPILSVLAALAIIVWAIRHARHLRTQPPAMAHRHDRRRSSDARDAFATSPDSPSSWGWSGSFEAGGSFDSGFSGGGGDAGGGGASGTW